MSTTRRLMLNENNILPNEGYLLFNASLLKDMSQSTTAALYSDLISASYRLVLSKDLSNFKPSKGVTGDKAGGGSLLDGYNLPYITEIDLSNADISNAYSYHAAALGVGNCNYLINQFQHLEYLNLHGANLSSLQFGVVNTEINTTRTANELYIDMSESVLPDHFFQISQSSLYGRYNTRANFSFYGGIIIPLKNLTIDMSNVNIINTGYYDNVDYYDLTAFIYIQSPSKLSGELHIIFPNFDKPIKLRNFIAISNTNSTWYGVDLTKIILDTSNPNGLTVSDLDETISFWQTVFPNAEIINNL